MYQDHLASKACYDFYEQLTTNFSKTKSLHNINEYLILILTAASRRSINYNFYKCCIVRPFEISITWNQVLSNQYNCIRILIKETNIWKVSKSHKQRQMKTKTPLPRFLPIKELEPSGPGLNIFHQVINQKQWHARCRHAARSRAVGTKSRMRTSSPGTFQKSKVIIVVKNTRETF
jgi:hypothetical protein